MLLKNLIIIGNDKFFSNIYSESAFVLVFSYYVKSNVTAMNVTMCNYGFEIDGVLKNQVNYYMKSYPLIV